MRGDDEEKKGSVQYNGTWSLLYKKPIVCMNIGKRKKPKKNFLCQKK